MKELKDIALQGLHRLFRVATSKAALEAESRGLPRVGLDNHGKLHEAPKPEEPPDVRSGNIVA